MFARRDLFVATLTLAAAALYFASREAAAAQEALAGNAIALAGVVVALAAIGVAAYALHRAAQMRSDFQRFSRSVEMALNDIASQTNRDSATIGELNRMVADEIRGMSGRQAAGAPAPAPDVAGARSRRVAPRPDGDPTTGAAGGAFEQALATALAADTLQISLQPIISVSQSTAVGFEVHAHVTDGEQTGRSLDVRRLVQPVAGLDEARFEQTMLRRAIETGRRQLGSDSERMPFHIAISEALLGNEKEMANLAELTSQHRALAKSVIFSLTIDGFDARGAGRDSLDRLTHEGYRLALENWAGDATSAAQAAARGVAFAKIAADRLLDRQKIPRKEPTGRQLVEALSGSGIQVIATGVNRDEDAVNLIDLGVDLMEGERFSGPRLIRAPASRRAAAAET